MSRYVNYIKDDDNDLIEIVILNDKIRHDAVDLVANTLNSDRVLTDKGATIVNRNLDFFTEKVTQQMRQNIKELLQDIDRDMSKAFEDNVPVSTVYR